MAQDDGSSRRGEMDLQRDGAEDELYTAGRSAPAGRYQRVDVAAGRTVVLEREDLLPASFDGRVALYRRIVSPVSLAVLRRQLLPETA
jgi:hypothetical protein